MISRIRNTIAYIYASVSLKLQLFRRVPTNSTGKTKYSFSETALLRIFQQDIANGARQLLDDDTWRDLGAQAYVNKVCGSSSLLGQQALISRLRCHTPMQTNIVRMGRARVLLANDKARADMQERIRPLALISESDAETLIRLHNNQDFVRLSPFLWAIPLSYSLAAALFSSSIWALLFAALGFLTSITAQILFAQDAIGADKGLMTLTRLLLVYRRLSEFRKPAPAVFSTEWDALDLELCGIAKAVSSIGTPSPLAEIEELRNLLFASSTRRYFKFARLISNHRSVVARLYRLLGDVESELAIADEIRFLPFTLIEPSACDIEFSMMRHPVYSNFSAINFSMTKRGLLITGPNGIGKSSVLRMIGLNIIIGQTLGFCYASSARAPLFYSVMSSINNSDSIETGQSYFMAELARASILLKTAKQSEGAETNTICLIDEIFSGTNYTESTATSASFLLELAKHSFSIVVTHNYQLASILSRIWEVQRMHTEESGLRASSLTSGISNHRSGLSLFSKYGFGEDVQARAERIAIALSKESNIKIDETEIDCESSNDEDILR